MVVVAVEELEVRLHADASVPEIIDGKLVPTIGPDREESGNARGINRPDAVLDPRLAVRLVDFNRSGLRSIAVGAQAESEASAVV